jgi:hypothetical protein
MRQQTAHAIEQYIEKAAIRYAVTNDKAQALDIVMRANSLIELSETVGLAKDF